MTVREVGGGEGDDDDDDDDMQVALRKRESLTFVEVISENIKTIEGFLDGL